MTLTEFHTDSQVKKLTFLSFLTAAALALSIIERFIPTPIAGVKPGLANIVCLFALLNLGYKDAMLINTARCILSSLLGGGLVSLIYSLSGGIISICVMFALLYFFKQNLSVVCISICGAITHIFIQLCIACLITGSVYVFELLPLYMLTSVLSGLFVGVICTFLTGFYNKFTEKHLTA